VLAEHEHKRDAALPFDLVGIFRILNKKQTQKGESHVARALPLLTRTGLVGSVRV